KVEFLADLAKASETDHFRNRFRCFIDATIYEERVELVCELPGLTEIAAGRDAPVNVGLPALSFLYDSDVDLFRFCKVVNRKPRKRGFCARRLKWKEINKL